jgi:anthranilate phosphoribosyltransferase
LSRDDARQLYAAMLDGGVPDLELGAIILGLRVKGESLDEMLGFLAAVDERTMPPRDATWAGSPGRPADLQRGAQGSQPDAAAGAAAAALWRAGAGAWFARRLRAGDHRPYFRELGIMPIGLDNLQAQAMLEQGAGFACRSALCPGIHNLLTLRSRMGVRNSAHSLVKMLDPFHGEGVLVAAATHPEFIDLMRDMLVARGRRGISAARHRRRAVCQSQAAATPRICA